jgi:phospholipid/cholesterol/gamma-HCH transport system ATP-binding protein
MAKTRDGDEERKVADWTQPADESVWAEFEKSLPHDYPTGDLGHCIPVEDAHISLRGVTKSFGSQTVLEDITFDVPRGRITAVMGPSGTGKSVLLKNIIGLLTPDRGEIWIDGEETVSMGEKDRYRVRKKFGVLFQDGALFGSMTMYDNIAFPLREHTKLTEKEIRTKVLEKMELVGMLDHLNKFPGEVSGGMRKRAGLARALVTEPEIVFFDEPDSGLDPVRVAFLDELVRKLQDEINSTFFIITHNIASVMRTADYIGVLYRSNLVRFDTKRNLLNLDHPIINQFLAGRAKGPIGIDELATEESDIERQLRVRQEERIQRLGDKAMGLIAT